MKNQEGLNNEMDEMRILMEYMDGNKINEGVSNQQIKTAAKMQAKDTDTSGIENVREKEVISALQQLIDKFKGDGNQYSQKVKIYIEKLWSAVESSDKDINEEVIGEDLADNIISQYDIEALAEKIANEMKLSPSLIPILFEKIAKKLKSKRDNKILQPNKH